MPIRRSQVGNVSTGGAPFSTTFPATEDPISQGGNLWVLGGSDGLSWQNVRTNGGSPGIAYGVGPSAGFDDCLAFFQRANFSALYHYAYVIFKMQGGYTPPSSHEVGIYVGGTISANSAKGYEFGWQFQSSGPGPTRWNGALGDFTGNGTGNWTDGFTGSTFTLADGDRVDVLYDARSGTPTMSLWKNNAARTGSPNFQVSDTSVSKVVGGSPGMGFFARSGSGLDMTAYCVKEFGGGSA
jgi:hypothetical protein